MSHTLVVILPDFTVLHVLWADIEVPTTCPRPVV